MLGLTSPDHIAIKASEVIAGDVVVACTVVTALGRTEAIYHSDPYVAEPQADDPNCDCPGHQSLTDKDRAKPCVILYNGEIWDYACDVMPADDLVIIQKRPEAVAEQAPQAEQAEEPLPELRPYGKGVTFQHDGRRVWVFPTPQNRDRWSARAEGGKTIVSHRENRDEAVRAAVRYLNGDDSGRTGFDRLQELLSL
ncbi:hypothetical protein SUDANB1_05605 [Streptomyces sp. enrichment culture]|uniref:hypothetical protein n=1 Tax=Streptomyces sp. enrichment culture TaxID=1795815 RepID=UPI003F56089F